MTRFGYILIAGLFSHKTQWVNNTMYDSIHSDNIKNNESEAHGGFYPTAERD